VKEHRVTHGSSEIDEIDEPRRERKWLGDERERE